MIDEKRVARSLLDDAGDTLAVMRREGERAQDQEVERSRSRVSFGGVRVRVGILPEYYATWVECQQNDVILSEARIWAEAVVIRHGRDPPSLRSSG